LIFLLYLSDLLSVSSRAAGVDASAGGEEAMQEKKKKPVTKPAVVRVEGPLAAYAGGFGAELRRLGHTPLTAAAQLRLMAHLSR
jgi:hypothetical protein